MKEGVAGRKGRLLKLDPHAVDGRAEDVIGVPGILQDPMKRSLQLVYPHAGPDTVDCRLLSFEVELICRLLH